MSKLQCPYCKRRQYEWMTFPSYTFRGCLGFKSQINYLLRYNGQRRMRRGRHQYRMACGGCVHMWWSEHHDARKQAENYEESTRAVRSMLDESHLRPDGKRKR